MAFDVAEAQESTNADLSSQPLTASKEEIEETSHRGGSTGLITEADEKGFTMSVTHVARIQENEGEYVALNPKGQAVIRLSNKIRLKDGTAVPVKYKIEQDKIVAVY